MAFEKYSASGILAYALPLYLSPVLSGVSNAPWAAVPLFALLFAALILKTRKTPQGGANLAVSVSGILLINGAITSALFGLGRAIMPMTGMVTLPLWLPIAICALAAGWGIWRYRWTPATEEMDAFLNEALSQLQSTPPTDDPDEK